MSDLEHTSRHDPDTFDAQKRLFDGMLSVAIKSSAAIAVLLLVMMWTLT